MSSVKIITAGMPEVIAQEIAQSPELKELGIEVDSKDGPVGPGAQVVAVADHTSARTIELAKALRHAEKEIVIIGAACLGASSRYNRRDFVLNAVELHEPFMVTVADTSISRQAKQQMRQVALRPPKMQAMAAKCRRR